MVILLLYSAKLNWKTGPSVNDTNHLSCGLHIFTIHISLLDFGLCLIQSRKLAQEIRIVKAVFRSYL